MAVLDEEGWTVVVGVHFLAHGPDAGEIVEDRALRFAQVATGDAPTGWQMRGSGFHRPAIAAARIEVRQPDGGDEAPDQGHAGCPVEDGAAVGTPRRTHQDDPKPGQRQRREDASQME